MAVFLLAGAPVQASPHLDRAVIIVRHGTRPPTVSNAALAKYADQPWPAWPVAPGELTPQGGAGVRIVGETIAAAYRKAGLLPAEGCAPEGQVSVWADNADERTRDTGVIFASALQPGCSLAARWSPAAERDAIFTGTDQASCSLDRDKVRLATETIIGDPLVSAPLEGALARLQAILAPNACSGGAGTCLAQTMSSPGPPGMSTMFPVTAGLAEDIYLEYADDMPIAAVGWGRARRRDIDFVMAIHEHAFALIRDNAYVAERRGGPEARIVLAALAGAPVAGGPMLGPHTKLLTLVGHDSNLAWMAGVFGLAWTFPDNPDFTAPSTSLALELWSDRGRQYVRPVVYFLGLGQMRALAPARAKAMPLTFKECANGPMGSCPLETLRQRVEAELPRDCGQL
jgi:4-phytase/acid phosphatase